MSVFIEYTPELHRFLRRFARNDLQDLMQEIGEAFLRVPRETVIHDPVKYLFGIARHIRNRYLAKAQRDPVALSSSGVDGWAEVTDQASIDSAEFDAISHDLLRQIARLPRMYREVLTLRFEKGLSIKRIAQDVSLSEATVKKYLCRAKALLRMGGT